MILSLKKHMAVENDFNPYDLSDVASVDVIYLPGYLSKRESESNTTSSVPPTKGILAPEVKRAISQEDAAN